MAWYRSGGGSGGGLDAKMIVIVSVTYVSDPNDPNTDVHPLDPT